MGTLLDRVPLPPCSPFPTKHIYEYKLKPEEEAARTLTAPRALTMVRDREDDAVLARVNAALTATPPRYELVRGPLVKNSTQGWHHATLVPAPGHADSYCFNPGDVIVDTNNYVVKVFNIVTVWPADYLCWRRAPPE